MSYSVVKFKMEHLDKYPARQEQKAEIEYLKKHVDAQELWQYKLPVFSLFADDVPVLIYGMSTTGWGTYFPMVFAGEGIDKHRFAVVRCLYDYAEKFVGADVRRFEAYIAVTDRKSCRLAKFFGFEPIGIRRQAGVNGEDQVIYERLWRK